MKKLLLCLSMSALLFTGCSDDDEGVNVRESDLLKKWYFVSTSVEGITFPYDDHEECGLDYIEFLPNGVAKQVDVWDCEIYTDLYSWSLNGDRLTLAYEGEVEETVTVTKITNSELHIKFRGDWDDDGDEETVTQKLSSVEFDF